MNCNVRVKPVRQSTWSPFRSTFLKPGLAVIASFLRGWTPGDPPKRDVIRATHNSAAAYSPERSTGLGCLREIKWHPSQCRRRSLCGAHPRWVAGTDRWNQPEPSRRTASPPSPVGMCLTSRNLPAVSGTLRPSGDRRLPSTAVSPATAGTALVQPFTQTAWALAQPFGSRGLSSTTTSARVSPPAVETANRSWPRVKCRHAPGCETGMALQHCLPAGRPLRRRLC